MTRHEITLRMRPVEPRFAAVYKARGMHIPELHSGDSIGALIPLELRRVHQIWANMHGYFWLPCILCGTEFGGHEITDTIPNPTKGEGYGICICPYCTIERNTGQRR